MSKHVDKLKGGVADKKQPKDFDKDQLAVGTAHEMEHTKDKTLAQEIAMDHLSEDPSYYKKLKDVEKYDRVEREADGKTELDYGKEKLDKPVKKSLNDRWNLIKADLDNSAAILDLSTLTEDDEDEMQPPQEDEDQEPVSDEENEGDDEDMDSDEEPQEDDSERPEWLPDDVPHDDEQMEGDQDADQDLDSEEGEQELIEALRDMGHSDSEIAHIVHGHMTPPVDEVKRAKAEAERAGMGHDEEAHNKEMEIRDQEAQIEAEHAKRMKDVEYQRAQKESGETDLDLEHKKRLQDLEYQKAQAESQFNEAAVEAEHKKRMLDLEYETAKKQKELELQFKMKEHEMKLKHAEEMARQKHAVQMQAAKENGKAKLEENKAKIAERKAESKKKTSMKKSEDESDDLEKAAGWSYNPKTGQMGHSEHGFVNVRPSHGGSGFDIVHNGKVVGTHADHGSVKTALTDYMKGLGQPMKVSGAAPIPTIQGAARQTSTEMDDSPYSLQSKFQQQAKNRVMDRQERAGIKNTPPADPNKPVVIRNKAGQVMDLPERRYGSIPDLPKKEKA